MATLTTGEPAGASPVDAAGSAPPGPPLLRRLGALLVRGRLALVCLGFLLLSLLQQPGRVLGDTKLDLVVDPAGFLARALTLWEPEGAAGQVQNQAYGYFFPMGPFFAAGDLVGLPPWLVQRFWLALLMSLAFLGVVLLARRLGIGTPATAMVAGIAYALAPRMVTALGATSVEVVPMALAPWVLVPLAGAARHGSARRAGLLSALAVFCVGGVNAVATSAVLPLAVLFLLTRPAGPLRRRLVLWWGAGVALATAWWAGPLLLLGRFSPPFLYYIETASTTTAPTDVLSVLRGTSHWVAQLSSPSGPTWPAGWSLVHDALPVAGTVVLAAAGLVALCRRDVPERVWLVLGVLAGVGLVTLGHLASVQGQWAGPLHDALDGALSPLRNVHKFDPVLRLPLALGLAHLGAVLLRRARRRGQAPAGRAARWARGGGRVASAGVLGVLVVALVATASPALAGRLAPPTGFTEVPGHWARTADFLADEQPSGRALLVPGSSFGTYEWGTTGDEPLQPLAGSAWDVRNAIPLTPEGHIRLLDAVEERLARGEGSAGLARYLARAGFSHLVLRNDLDTGAAAATRPLLVRQALRDSPGITPVASFGPVVRDGDRDGGRLVDAGLVEPAPAVEVYAVADPAPRAWTAPLSAAVTVRGGPESVLELEDRGLVTDRPILMAGTTDLVAGPTMAGDAQVRRERNFGRLAGATSGGLALDDPRRLDTPVRDYRVPGLAGAESVVRYTGAAPSASSSAADPDGFTPTRLDSQPWSAVDGDLTTAWRPAPWAATDEPSWWRLTADRRFLAGSVVVTLGTDLGGERPARLRLTTDAGALTVPVADVDAEQVLPLPPGYTGRLTISATETGPDAPALVLAEVRVPGVTPERSVVLPQGPGSVDVVAVDAERGRSGCAVDADGVARCAPLLVEGPEEAVLVDRTFGTDARAEYDVVATGVPRPGAALDAVLGAARGSTAVTASSTPVADPRATAAAAVDGDPGTAWLADGEDADPTLVLTYPQPRAVDSLRVVPAGVGTGVAPTAVTVDDGTQTRTLPLGADGTVTFPAVVTARLAVTFETAGEVRSTDPYTRWQQRLGVAVAELEVGGPNPVTPATTPVVLPCGQGPRVQVDGVVLDTSVSTTTGALQALQPVPLTVCDTSPRLALPGGEHRVIGRSSAAVHVDSVTLTRAGAPLAPPTPVAGRAAAEVTRWDAEHRAVEVAARAETTLLVVPENPNVGWTARLGDQRLETVTVDGWQQGYVLPAGAAGTVRLDFPGGSEYRQALLGGAGAVALLAVVAVLPARPSRSGGGRRRPRPRALAVVAAVAAGVVLVAAAAVGTALVGGTAGLVAVGALWVAGALLPGGWRSGLLGTVAGGALLAAGGMLLADRAGTADARQVLAIVALAAVVAGVLPAPRLRRRPSPPPDAGPEQDDGSGDDGSGDDGTGDDGTATPAPAADRP
ncbi:alpha-(1-_3)-arabinofuranosyltransferase [Blastococcus sp. SYSU D00695]